MAMPDFQTLMRPAESWHTDTQGLSIVLAMSVSRWLGA